MVAGYTSGQPNGFGPKGMLQRDDMVAVAAVRVSCKGLHSGPGLEWRCRVWPEAGQRLARAAGRRHSVYAVGVGRQGCAGWAPASAAAKHAWYACRVIRRAGLPLPSLPARLQALPETTGFVTGETILVDRAPTGVVRYWDVAGGCRLAPCTACAPRAVLAERLHGFACS